MTTTTTNRITVSLIVSLIGWLSAALAVTGTARAQQTTRVSAAPTSRLWIDGTSNLHAWSCKTDRLDAQLELDASAIDRPAAAAPQALKRVEVKVPVRSLKCGHGGMDDNLYKALNADASPDVSYILAKFDAAPATMTDSMTLHTVGTLTVAGKQNSVAMDITAVRMADGTVKATGHLPIKMTDYGIKPPTAIFGRLKTGDLVTVNFELTVGAKAVASALPVNP